MELVSSYPAGGGDASVSTAAVGIYHCNDSALGGFLVCRSQYSPPPRVPARQTIPKTTVRMEVLAAPGRAGDRSNFTWK